MATVAVVFNAYYIFYANGLFLGSFLILAGTAIVYKSVMTLIKAAEFYQTCDYEEMALKAFGV
jgi:hypothetical protein